MKFSKLYPSKYLAASDLDGQSRRAKIDTVKLEEVGPKKDWKPVLYLLNVRKAVVLNKTNGKVLEKAYGDDTDRWHGKLVELYPARVEFQGDLMDAIRMRIPTTGPKHEEDDQEEPPPIGDDDAPPPQELDDEVDPFE